MKGRSERDLLKSSRTSNICDGSPDLDPSPTKSSKSSKNSRSTTSSSKDDKKEGEISEEKSSTNKDTGTGTISRSGRQIVPTNRWRPADHADEDQLLRKTSNNATKEKSKETEPIEITKNKKVLPRVLLAEEGSPSDYMLFDSRPIPVVLPKDPVRRAIQEPTVIVPEEVSKENEEIEVVKNDIIQDSELAKTLTGVLAKLTAIPKPTDIIDIQEETTPTVIQDISVTNVNQTIGDNQEIEPIS